LHDILRERLWRSLEALPEERLYQVLDYVEFLGSKYAREGVKPASSPLRRFGERLEDRMRMNGVAFGAIRGTLEAMGTADRVVSDLAAAGRSLLSDLEEGLRTPPPRPASPEDRPPLQIQPPSGREEEPGVGG
jgi:hypothetical protein